ncbi:MAG: hypothetical protein IKW90_11745 [Lachnospiraceae bacterium]|nr:hypothetical protein [Lachnospiraceae bacterium]
MSVRNNPLSIGQIEADLFMAESAMEKADTLQKSYQELQTWFKRLKSNMR